MASPLPHGKKVVEFQIKVKVSQLCLTLCDPVDCPENSPGQNTGVGSLSLFQGSSLPRDGTQDPALQVDSLPTELSGKPFSSNLSPKSRF